MVTKEEIFEKSHQLAIKSLQKFLKNIGLNSEDFKHLYELQITPGVVLLSEDAAEYNYYNNTIKLNVDRLAKLTQEINKKKESENKVALNIAEDIVHEIIHANRTVAVIDPSSKTLEKNLISYFYVQKPDEDEEYARERANYQVSLEEVLTDAIAEIIIKSRNYENFEFQEIKRFLKGYADAEINIGLDIIEAVDSDVTETLKNFMIAAYQKQYIDPFEEVFQDEYDDLLFYVDDIYQADYCNEQISSTSIEKAKEIIERKKVQKIRK